MTPNHLKSQIHHKIVFPCSNYPLHYSDLPSLISLPNSYSAFKTPAKNQLPWISTLSSERMKRFFLCSPLCVYCTMVSVVSLSSPSNCVLLENIPRPRIMPNAWETGQTFDELIDSLNLLYSACFDFRTSSKKLTYSEKVKAGYPFRSN